MIVYSSKVQVERRVINKIFVLFMENFPLRLYDKMHIFSKSNGKIELIV